jgi:DNA polymerase-3 subunit epsilon
VHIRTRDGFATIDINTPAVAELSRGVHASVDVAPYVELLDRALADLQLTDDEIRDLDELADHLGLDHESRRRAHSEFLNGLIDAALDDGIVTSDEYDVLCRTASLLAIDHEVVTTRIEPFRATTTLIELEAGREVCFTGAALNEHGEPVDRSELEQAATDYGLVPARSVTKRGQTLLVAADPASRSSKVRTARRHGLPVTSVTDFLAAVTGNGTLQVQLVDQVAGLGVVCQQCGASWVAPAPPEHALCDECQPLPDAAEPVASVGTPPPVIETLTCIDCGSNWQRPRVRGRKPHRCPDCVSDSAVLSSAIESDQRNPAD